MAQITRMDLLRQASSLANQGLQIWGLTQEQRRSSEFQGALTRAREGFTTLFTQLEGEPDFNQHEQMFIEGSNAILENISQDFLSDPYVKQQFDLQWMGVEENARQAAMEYSKAREQAYRINQGFKDLESTLAITDFTQSRVQMEAIVNGLYEAGMFGTQAEDARDEMMASWFRGAGAQLEQRIEAGVNASDKEAISATINSALRAGVIVDPKTAADREAAAHYQVDYNAAENFVRGAIFRQISETEWQATAPQTDTQRALFEAEERRTPEQLIAERAEQVRRMAATGQGPFGTLKPEDMQTFVEMADDIEDEAIANVAHQRKENTRQVREILGEMDSRGLTDTVTGLDQMIATLREYEYRIERPEYITEMNYLRGLRGALIAEANGARARVDEEVKETFIGAIVAKAATGLADRQDLIGALVQGLPGQTGEFAGLLTTAEFRTISNYIDAWVDDTALAGAYSTVAALADKAGLPDAFQEQIVGRIMDQIQSGLGRRYFNIDENGVITRKENFDEAGFQQEVQNIFDSMTQEYRRRAGSNFIPGEDVDIEEIGTNEERALGFLWRTWDSSEKALREIVNGKGAGWEDFSDDDVEEIQNISRAYVSTFANELRLTPEMQGNVASSMPMAGAPFMVVRTPDRRQQTIAIGVNEATKNEQLYLWIAAPGNINDGRWEPITVSRVRDDGYIHISGYNTSTHRYEDVR